MNDSPRHVVAKLDRLQELSARIARDIEELNNTARDLGLVMPPRPRAEVILERRRALRDTWARHCGNGRARLEVVR